jgi:hypothetical protein
MISLSIVPQYHQSMFFPLGDEVTHPYEIIHKLERLKFKDYIFRKQSIPNLMEERVPRLNLPLVSSYGDLLLSFPVILMFSVLENKTTTERKSNKYSQTCPTVNRTLYCFFCCCWRTFVDSLYLVPFCTTHEKKIKRALRSENHIHRSSASVSSWVAALDGGLQGTKFTTRANAKAVVTMQLTRVLTHNEI